MSHFPYFSIFAFFHVQLFPVFHVFRFSLHFGLHSISSKIVDPSGHIGKHGKDMDTWENMDTYMDANPSGRGTASLWPSRVFFLIFLLSIYSGFLISVCIIPKFLHKQHCIQLSEVWLGSPWVSPTSQTQSHWR